MRFYLNNVMPSKSEETRKYEISFNRFLCEDDKSLMYINKHFVDRNLVHDNFSLHGKKWESFCLRIKECNGEKEVLILLVFRLCYASMIYKSSKSLERSIKLP